MEIKSSIESFIIEFIAESPLNEDMRRATLKLLHSNGKLFNKNTYFSWGEFSYHVFSLLIEDIKVDKIAHAAAIELLILSTDIIDDLIDDDMSIEYISVFSKSNALILSNALLIESIYLLVKSSVINPIESFTLINKNLLNANNGQWQDYSFTINSITATEENYFELIKKKSCSLIHLIFDLYNLRKDPILEEISSYIGFSWQIKNDVTNILSDTKSDITQKKATLPIIKALEFSQEKDDGLLFKMFEEINKDQSNLESLKEIQDYIKNTGAIDYCIILEKIYIRKSEKLLKKHFPNKEIQVGNLLEFLD